MLVQRGNFCISEEWFKKSSMYFGPIQQESQAQDAVLEDLTKSIDTQIQLVQNEQMNPTEKKCSPEVSLRPVARPAHIEQRAELGSTRPVPRPEALQVDADLEALLFKSDNEKPLLAHKAEVKKGIGEGIEIIFQEVAVGDHAANGHAESAVREVQKHCRVMDL